MFKRKKRSIYEPLVKRIHAYECRDGQIFKVKSAAEAYENILLEKERIADNIGFANQQVALENIPTKAGFVKTRLESEHLEALEIWALDWKGRYFGYEPNIGSAYQLDKDGPWIMELNRWGKC